MNQIIQKWMNKRIKEKKGWMKNQIEVKRMNVKINELGNKWEKMERKNERKKYKENNHR